MRNMVISQYAWRNIKDVPLVQLLSIYIKPTHMYTLSHDYVQHLI